MPTGEHGEQTDEFGDPLIEVQKKQPGTWPTSVLDLELGSPAAERAVSEPIGPETFAYLPESGEPAAADTAPSKGVTTAKQGDRFPSFDALVRIDGEQYSFAIQVTGSREFVEGMIVDFASRFASETDPKS